ncbi:MAG TPA: hypothetical protein VNI34_05975 [Candidatus Nitrosotalea sp.]|nr:hypothetical protein [Candidatus Nitrosotalea sp.]
MRRKSAVAKGWERARSVAEPAFFSIVERAAGDAPRRVRDAATSAAGRMGEVMDRTEGLRARPLGAVKDARRGASERVVLLLPEKGHGRLRRLTIMLALGAAGAYLLDPELGRGRRQRLADASRNAAHRLDRATVEKRATLLATLRRRRPELLARVRDPRRRRPAATGAREDADEAP